MFKIFRLIGILGAIVIAVAFDNGAFPLWEALLLLAPCITAVVAEDISDKLKENR